VQVEGDAEEVTRLRGVLRDLVALSATPAVRIGGEPPAVAAGLADALVSLLQLDFVHVRMSDPGGHAIAEATRGSAWKSFPEWLEGHLAPGAPFLRTQVVRDVGDPSAPRRGLAAPIGVNGQGGVVVASAKRGDFPTPTEQLLLSVATNQAAAAFQNAHLIHERKRAEEELREARDELERNVSERTAELHVANEELSALRRLAVLVAEGVQPQDLFAVVAEEVARVVNVPLVSVVRYEPEGTGTEYASYSPDGPAFPVGRQWSLDGTNVLRLVRESGEPARIDDYVGLEGEIAEVVRRVGICSTVAVPVVVAGRVWGAMVASTTEHRPLPPGTEARLDEFTELLATAIENAESRDALERVGQEQAALRRVATLVARGGSEAEIFTAIAQEMAQLVGAQEMRMFRLEADGTAVVVARWGSSDTYPLGARVPRDGPAVSSPVFRTGRPARVDDFPTPGGTHSIVGTPILVEGRVWGAMIAATPGDAPLPRDTESRLGEFSELIATAIANAEARAEVKRLADEQAALRRVATLVAKEASVAEVFARVAEEVANVVGDVDCALWRDEGDGTVSAVAVWGASVAAGIRVGTRVPLDGQSVIVHVLGEGRPSRIDDYSATEGSIAERARAIGLRAALGCPIVVGGRTWGVMAVASYEAEPFSAETETRVAQFSDLVATAIANAQAHTEVERLADEQAGLRRVATLVAQGAAPHAVFDAVAAEMERLLGADGVTLSRYEPDAEVTVVAHRGSSASRVPPGTRVRHDGDNVTTAVRDTERPARKESYEGTRGAIAELVKDLGVRTSVGTPIVVDGRLWGVAIANWTGEESPPPGTEERMAQFAELLDTAIANADSRDQLTASRVRLVTEGDEARRRVVRDLHDGAQQRLVHTIISLKLAQRALREGGTNAESLVGEALVHAEQGNVELRELAHGILPAVLTRGGLRAGVDALVARLDLPVAVDVPSERFPAETEASAYFIVAEALTNVVKHSQARRAQVSSFVRDSTLHIEVRDDGIGGADPNGHGLVGMRDRVTALGGRLEIATPAGGGTRVTATLLLSAD
jgi:GAF domain-containing protein